jgi:hypothetical protein
MNVLFALLVAPLFAVAPEALRVEGADGLAAISGAALSAHVRFLADDLLEGRGTGTRGHAAAARYVASQFERIGLQPGNGKSWFQPVPLRGFKVDLDHSTLTFHGKKGKATLLPNATAFVMSNARGAAEVEAPVVFAGYAIANGAYDDAGAVRGKIAFVLDGAPPPGVAGITTTSEAAVRSSSSAKVQLLAARGALAVIFIRSPEDDKRVNWVATLEHFDDHETMTWRDGDKLGTPTLPAVIVQRETFDKLLGFAGRTETSEALFADGKAGKLRPFALPLTAHLKITQAVRDFSSENVVALLRGSDAALADEYVVYTAHLDHLGIGRSVGGDRIYNGADDDAAGVAALLELGRAFAALPTPPSRSILFVAVTGEEMGLRGSDYFVHRPPVPIASIVADINLDAPVGYWDPHDLVPLGAEHSTLQASVAAACAALDFKVSPDPEPEQVYFIRSDQFSFVKRGVPSIFPGAGLLDDAGGRANNARIDAAMHAKRYHQPADQWDPARNYEFAAKEVRVDFLIGLAVANERERPRWNDGDPFAAFAR